jgi:hypothetical protein
MNRFQLATTFGIVLALAPLLAPAQERPRIGYVYPAGGRQGTTFQVTLGGRYLNGISRIHFSGAGVEVNVVPEAKPMTEEEYNVMRKRAEALMRGKPDEAARKEIAQIKRKLTRLSSSRYVRQSFPAIGETVTLRVTLAANAEPGRREMRLESQQGISNPFRFYVGQLPEFREQEPGIVPQTQDFWGPNLPPLVITDITLPAVVNGQLIPRDPDSLWLAPDRFTPGGADRFRFEAKKGQQLVIVAAARELIPYLPDAVPGWFQATLAVYDAKGKELAYGDDFRFHPDPVLLVKIPEDGQYVLEIKDAIYRGRPDFVYRITIGELPFITGIFPLGGQAGTQTAVKLSGWNLPTDTLTVDAKDKGPCTHPLSVRKGDMTSNTVPFLVDTLPECLEKEANDSQSAAQKVELPLIINGRIDRPGDIDVFRFEGRAGQQVIAEVTARRLESPLDSVLELTDAAGKVLAFNDDHDDKADGMHTHQSDSLVHFTLPADGAYYVRLADSQRHGGPEYAYRLRLSEPRPDFELRVTPSCINSIPWRLNPITVFALRKDGFSGEIALGFKEGTEGLALSGGVVPEGQDRVRVTLAVASLLAPGPISLNLEGRATIGGKEVVRQAAGADEMMQAFFYKHLVPARDLTLVPEDRTRFKPQPVRPVGKPAGTPPKRPAFQPSWAILSEQPVKVPAGGTAEVQISMSWDRRSEIQVELSDPPDGITVERAARNEKGLTLVLRGDAQKAKPGLRSNLMANAFSKTTVTDKEGRTRDVRNFIGPLPAMPFEIVKPTR